jgi:HK97 family phage major capsid protein
MNPASAALVDHHLREVRKQLSLNAKGGAERFSLARAMIEANSEAGLRNGLEFEICTEAARAAGQVHDKNRPFIPWHVLTSYRDLTAASASGGGYLVETVNVDAVDILRKVSALARAGMEILPDLRANITVPKVSTSSTGYWLSNEASTITESAMVFGQIAMVPHTGGALLEVSRQLLIQAPQADSVIRRDLLRTIGQLIDEAVLNGSGASGQPLGLLGTTGVVAQAGAALTYASVLGMQQSVGEANADDPDVSAITTNAVRKVLSGRERATGSGFIWDSNMIAGMVGRVTEAMPAGTLIMGPWATIVLGLWGPGPQIAANPYDSTGFKTGIEQFRCLVSCDVGVRQATAFVAATSVS